MSTKQIELAFVRHPVEEMERRAATMLAELKMRRSVREFSAEPIPRQVLIDCIATAAQAPSGANKQPWTFVLVTDPTRKREIRQAAEKEEQAFYRGGAGERWLRDLAPLGTGWEKPFLETAPALIAVFAQTRGSEATSRHYYVQESVGIACGFLIAALHHAGLATLTHTPSPMRFLSELLGRPTHERPYLLLPVGYPAQGCQVPALARKGLDQLLVENPR
ncbi:MAG: nitroreductase family protein [Deltaproteobacteria bacterium]|nr:nitroreductase family protein [Deltaproteobacteria bacterium]